MTIKIEITGASIQEVADKLLAVGGSLRATASYDADNAAREALQAQRDDAKPKAAPKKVKPVAEEAQPAPVAPTAEPAPSLPEPDAAPLDFDKDVAPVVLKLVQTKGRDWVQDVLTQFGVERASQLPPEQFAELIAALQDGAE